jgi:glyoxylase-like metal-dependent hydrolase (beta-lactamase superfamily II)
MLKVTRYDPVTRFDLARTLFGRGRYWTSAHLVDGLLIDSGCAHSAPELASALEKEHLTLIVNTHTHEDHIGANGLLQHQHPSLEILAHPLALPVLSNPRRAQPLHIYRRLFWGWPEPCQARPLADGERVHTEHYTFQVIYTPGHSPDHLCLYEANQGWLFSGDLFVGGSDRALRQGHDIWQMIASLKCIAALPITRLFPGSARLRENPAQELREKIAYYELLGEQVLELNEKGWSVPRIARRLCGGPMWVELVTLGHFSRQRLVRSYLSQNSE